MKIRVPDYYYKFNCIADKCTDTCCTHWDVVIDDKTQEFYSGLDGELGERIRESLSEDEDGDVIFKCKNGRCPFLAPDGLCDIQAQLGEEALSYTCRQYPRFFDEFGGLQEYGLSFSCPEAARLITEHSDKITFNIEERPDISITPNDIDAEFFMFLLSTRDKIFEIIQNRNERVWERVKRLYSYGLAVQKAIDEEIYEVTDIKEVSIDKSSSDIITAFKRMVFLNTDYYKFAENLIKNRGETDFDEYILEREYEYENFLVYMIFRYYLKAVDDYNAFEKINIAILSYIAVREMGKGLYAEKLSLTKAENTRIMQLYSKEIEHSGDNMDVIRELCK